VPTLIDANVLSNLAAVDRFDLLDLLQDPIYLSSTVYDETQRGVEEGYTFLAKIDQALADARLSVTTLEGEQEWRLYQTIPTKLHRGEAMSLTIARCREWHLLTDDRAARMVARRLGVAHSGTLALLIRAVRQGHLTLDEGNDLLVEMIARARYRSPVSDLRDLLKE
jgi:predicted nucleic acid-binding protein